MPEKEELMTEEEKKKWWRPDSHLRCAFGLEFQVVPAGVTSDTPGVVEIRPYPPRGSYKVYFDLRCAVSDDADPGKLEITVPEILREAPWGEIIFNNNKPGALVLFGREEEEVPFGPTEGKYVFLRLYRQEEYPFRSVYVRVDKGVKTYFFALHARWEGNLITIEVEREPEHIPHFLG